MKDVRSILTHVKEVDKKSIPALDLSQLTFCGHSYGGMTALEACHKFPEEFEYCIAIDPGNASF